MASRETSVFTNGSGDQLAFDYTTDIGNVVTAIQNLTTAVYDLQGSLNNAIGSESQMILGSLGNSAYNSSKFLQAVGGLGVDGNKKSAEGLGALGLIAKSLHGIASAINTGVAMQTLATNDQMKKNAFDKEATQAALKRNKLPEVTVSDANFLQTVQTNIQEGGKLFANASAAGLVNTTASTAISGAATWAYDLLPSGADISNQFKSFFKASSSDTSGVSARTDAQTKLVRT